MDDVVAATKRGLRLTDFLSVGEQVTSHLIPQVGNLIWVSLDILWVYHLGL